MLVIRLLIFMGSFFFTSNILFSQSLSIKGQFWGGMLKGDGSSLGHSAIESSLGYIPTMSIYKRLDNNQLLDIEFSYRLNYWFQGDSLTQEQEKFHRFWFRYSTNEIEARIGLQKIVFGPSQIFRSLSWFDTIDLKDPTNQTEGVEAFRLRWFPSNSLSLWLWSIMDEENNFFHGNGGRGELSTRNGEWGFTFHVNPSKDFQNHGMAIDFRYDGLIGFWNENSRIKFNESSSDMIIVGADYTLPIFNNMLIMAEAMFVSIEQKNMPNSFQRAIAFMSSSPIGMFHNFMLISEVNLENNQSNNYLRWSSTYDSVILNYMISTKAKEEGNSFQLMLIFNH